MTLFTIYLTYHNYEGLPSMKKPIKKRKKIPKIYICLFLLKNT